MRRCEARVHSNRNGILLILRCDGIAPTPTEKRKKGFISPVSVSRDTLFTASFFVDVVPSAVSDVFYLEYDADVSRDYFISGLPYSSVLLVEGAALEECGRVERDVFSLCLKMNFSGQVLSA